MAATNLVHASTVNFESATRKKVFGPSASQHSRVLQLSKTPMER